MPGGNRAWCFTLNHPTQDETSALPTSADTLWAHCVALCYQLEQGDAGTPHFQGYARFDIQRGLNAVRSLIPGGRAHWEPARGSPSQNLAYCTKPDGRLSEPVVIGQFGGQRGLPGGPNAGGRACLKRADFISIIQDNPHVSTAQIIEQGGLDIIATQPNLLGTLRGYLLADERRDGVTVELFYGPTGTGKSRLAHELYPGAYRKAPGIWWDFYQGESVVILDDFDSDFMLIGDLLRSCDRYPVSVPVKGGFVRLVATHFVITSNELPAEWYPKASVRRIAAVCRRIGSVIDFSGNAVLQHEGAWYFNPALNSRGQPFILPWERIEPEPEPSPLQFELSDPVTPTQVFLGE